MNDFDYKANTVILILGLFFVGGCLLFLNPSFVEMYAEHFAWLPPKFVPAISVGLGILILLPSTLMKELEVALPTISAATDDVCAMNPQDKVKPRFSQDCGCDWV